MTQYQLSAEAVVFSAATVSATLGFLCSITLYSYAKWRVRPNRASLRCLYQYSAIFFGGTALLCVDWMMADRAPIPLRPVLDAQNRMGFAVLMCIWSLVCLSSFMAHRTLRVISKSPLHTPEGRNLVRARAANSEGRLHRGRVIGRRTRRSTALATD